MRVSRREALKTLGAGAAVPLLTTRAVSAQAEGLDLAALDALAEVVLPSEADRKSAVRAFTEWIADYKEGADTDHGYGNTRIRATGPSPAHSYPAQLVALDSAARAQGAVSFASASLEERRVLIETAIADAKIERLPVRPTGGHIATDLMGHYFNSPIANDLCYRAVIAREACRGLPGSDQRPAPRSSNLPPRK